MTLADLIDLEAQLARDRDAAASVLEARDRSLLGPAPPGPPGAALHRWLDALREAEPRRGWPGRPIEAAMRAVRAALAGLGLVLGWGAATAAVAFSGTHPVNVWEFLLGFVGVQVLLIALLVGSFFLPLAAAGAPFAGPLRRAIGAAVRRASGWMDRGRAAERRVLWHRLRSRSSIYHRVETWLLLAATQSFGVAFNVGALLALLRLVVFTDLAFGWSTTLLDLDAARFHALVSALALPWRALWPDAVPSLALVEQTRYSHLEGAYLVVGGAAAADVGGWWRFLAAALACYGLLPRLVVLAVARARATRRLRRLPQDDAEVARLVRRLAEPHVETRGLPAPPPHAPAPRAPAAGAPPEPGAGPGALVVWRDAPAGPEVTAAVAREAGCAVGAVHLAGGLDDAPPPLRGEGPVIVLAESWEAPDRATLRFLRELRAALGPRRHLLVLLLDDARSGAVPPVPGLRIWQERLASLEDPSLRVAPLGASP